MQNHLDISLYASKRPLFPDIRRRAAGGGRGGGKARRIPGKEASANRESREVISYYFNTCCIISWSILLKLGINDRVTLKTKNNKILGSSYYLQ